MNQEDVMLFATIMVFLIMFAGTPDLHDKIVGSVGTCEDVKKNK